MPWASNLCQCRLLQPGLSFIVSFFLKCLEFIDSMSHQSCRDIMSFIILLYKGNAIGSCMSSLFKLFILLRSFLLLHFILHSNVFWNKLRIHFIDGVLNQYECKGIGVQQHPIWLGSWLSPCSPYHILRLCGLEKALGSLHDWGHGHVLCVFFRVNYFFLMICYYMYL